MRSLRFACLCSLALLASCDSKDEASPLSPSTSTASDSAPATTTGSKALSAADSAASKWLGTWTLIADSSGTVPPVSGRVTLRFLTDTSGMLVRYAWGDSAAFTYVKEKLSCPLVDWINLYRRENTDTLLLFSYLPTTRNAWIRGFTDMRFVRGLAPDKRRIASLSPMDLSDTVKTKPAAPDTIYDTVPSSGGGWSTTIPGQSTTKAKLIDYDTIHWSATDTVVAGIWRTVLRNGRPDTTITLAFNRPDSGIAVDTYFGSTSSFWYYRNATKFSICSYLGGNRPMRLLGDTLALGYDGVELRFLRRYKPTSP